MLLRKIAARLGNVAFSADVAIVIAARALFHPAGAVVQLTLVNLSLPCHPGIDDGVGHFRIRKLHHDG